MDVPAQEDNDSHVKLGFARRLASPNKRTREKAISLLLLWLSSQKEVKEEELIKIWKGLFYCVWHADKLPVQTDLIERLASLVEKLQADLSLTFFRVFLSTMRREWGGIDRLRLDKFYLLLRKYLARMFSLLQKHAWDAVLTKNFMDALVERMFLAKDQYAAQGVNLHYADIFLSELERFLPLETETFEILLDPFWIALAEASDKSFVKRIKENIFDRLLDLGCTVCTAKQEGRDLDETVENLGSLALVVPMSSRAFELASLSSTCQSNRKVLYELYEDFKKLEKLSAAWNECAPSVKRQKLEPREQDRGARNFEVGVSDFLEDNRVTMRSEGPVEAGNSVQGQKSALSEGNIVSPVMMVANTNLLSGQEVGDSLVKGCLKACEEENETAADKTGSEKKVSMLQKRFHKGKVSGLEITEISPEVERQATGSIDPSKKKRRRKSPDVIEGDRISMPEADSVCSVTTKALSRESKDAGKDAVAGTENSGLGVVTGESCVVFDDSVISNLEKRFDSIAAEGSDDMDTSSPLVFSFPLAPSPINTGSKKRKRGKGSAISMSQSNSSWSGQENGSPGSLLRNSADSTDKLSDKKVKKVRFSLKHNLVWKPYGPLPPQILRVPPSATPKGSALKKGVPPGPIIVVKEASPKRRKGATGRTTPSAQRSPKSLKNLARGSKLKNQHRLSPR